MTESLQTQDVKRFLAFNIPGKTPEESLEFYKTHFKEDYDKQIQEYATYISDEADKIQKCNAKSVERNKKTGAHSKQNSQNQLPNPKMNEVEQAFFLSFLRNSTPVLSDAEANKNKQNQPQGEKEEENPLQPRGANVSARITKEQVLLPPEEESSAQCICGKQDASKIWVFCDNCQKWFHAECLGYNKQQAEMLQKQDESIPWFHSDDCRKEHEAKHGAVKGK